MPDSEQLRVKILRRLASSQRSDLFLVELISSGMEKTCANVEIFSDAGFGSGGVLSQLATLAKLVNTVEAQGVPEVFEVLNLAGRIGVVMAPFDGVSIQGLTGEVLPPAAAVELVGSVAATLQQMLTKIPEEGQAPLSMRHGGLSASSVVIAASGKVSVVGFVKDKKANFAFNSSTLNFAMGPLDYMAPEQRFAEDEDASADVYALGALLYRVLTGRSFGQSGSSETAHQTICRKRLLKIENVLFGSSASQELLALLTQMLAFQSAMRPSAKSVASRFKALAVQLEGNRLVAWADQAVPRLSQASLPPQKGARIDLVGKTLKCSHSIEVNAESSTLSNTDDREGDDTQEQEVTVPHNREHHPIDQPPVPVDVDDLSVSDKSTSIVALMNASGEDECFATENTPPPPVDVGSKKRVRWLLPVLVIIAGTSAPIAGVFGVGVGAVATFGAISMGLISYDSHLAIPEKRVSAPEFKRATPSRGKMLKSRSESTQKQMSSDSARFVSKFTNTQRMVVRCDTGEEKAKGNELTYDISGAHRCVVSAIDGKRKRATTIVKNLEPRIYRCFENGESSCE